MSSPPAATLSRRWKLTRELLGAMSPEHRRGLIATYLVSSVAGVMLAPATKWIIDGIVTGDRLLAGYGVAVAAASAGIADRAGRASKDLRLTFTVAATHAMTVRALRAVAERPYLEHLERPDVQDQVQLVVAGGGDVAMAIGEALNGGRLAVQLILSVGMLVAIDPWLVLFPAFVLPSVVLVPRAHRISRQAREQSTQKRRLATLLHELFADTDAAMELRVFGASGALDRRADRVWGEAVQTEMRGAYRAALVSVVGTLALAMGFVGSVALVAVRAGRNLTAAGSMMMVIQLATRLHGELQGTVGLARQLREGTEVLDRAIWLEDFQPDNYPGPRDRPAPSSLTSGITLHDVSFRYPDTEHQVLTDLTLHLPAGSTIAVVGDNGAGKTTLVKLLCGFYQPTTGTIEIDGTPLAAIDPVDWATRLSGAFQDYLRLEDVFRHSVAPPHATQTIPDEVILRAADDGDALGMVDQWDDRLDTHLGKTYRDGQQLSGGQWQRVAAARALHRPTPLLLILDEPTAALDPAAEHHLFQRYSTAAENARQIGGITLLISHRFSTVKMADNIIVLDQGRLIEAGSHQHLLTNEGRYAEMFRRQEAAYR